jgi:anti-anti-sigma factor
VPLSDPPIESEGFAVSILAYADGLVIELTGEFDLTGVERFQEAFDSALLADRADIIIDFTRLSFIDSSGVEQLVIALNRLAAGNRRLCASGIGGQVERVLELVRLLEHLHQVELPPDAIAWPD